MTWTMTEPLHTYEPCTEWPTGLLLAAPDHGPGDGYVAFYGGPLSNFAPSTVVIGDAAYPTVEHWFQAQKPLDPREREAIRTARTPGQAKALGQRCQLRRDWDEVRYGVMLTGLRAKHLIPHYRDYLLATRAALIVEDSPTDFVWGIRDEHGGYGGQNLLGKALMKVRAELAAVPG